MPRLGYPERRRVREPLQPALVVVVVVRVRIRVEQAQGVELVDAEPLLPVIQDDVEMLSWPLAAAVTAATLPPPPLRHRSKVFSFDALLLVSLRWVVLHRSVEGSRKSSSGEATVIDRGKSRRRNRKRINPGYAMAMTATTLSKRRLKEDGK
jgi:hypothetical protein